MEYTDKLEDDYIFNLNNKEVKQMEEQNITNKPKKGTWDSLNQEDENKISFEVNIPYTVTFKGDEPEEIESGEGNVFYRFNVWLEGKEKYFTTSAWTLLYPLKDNSPLDGKTFTIMKKLVKGKQMFEVKMFEVK